MNKYQIIAQNTRSILIINPRGHIRELYCPFRVQCILAIDKIVVGTWVWVDKVTYSVNVVLLYQIHGNLYIFKHFAIHISF